MTPLTVTKVVVKEETEPQRLVRMLAFALRHHPLRFGVGLDDEGFADLDDLVVGIRFSHYDWATLDRAQVEDAIRGTDPGRFEIRECRARFAGGVASATGCPVARFIGRRRRHGSGDGVGR